MKIHCNKCGFYLGEVLAGSNLHKGIIYLCTECMSEYDTYKGIADYKHGTSTTPSCPPGFEDLLKGFKK
jgi:hypothetical protein